MRARCGRAIARRPAFGDDLPRGPRANDGRRAARRCAPSPATGNATVPDRAPQRRGLVSCGALPDAAHHPDAQIPQNSVRTPRRSPLRRALAGDPSRPTIRSSHSAASSPNCARSRSARRGARHRRSKRCSASTPTASRPCANPDGAVRRSMWAAPRKSGTSSGRRCSSWRRDSRSATRRLPASPDQSRRQQMAGAPAGARRAADRLYAPGREAPALSLRALGSGEMERTVRGFHARLRASVRAGAASPHPDGRADDDRARVPDDAAAAPCQSRQSDAEGGRMDRRAA